MLSDLSVKFIYQDFFQYLRIKDATGIAVSKSELVKTLSCLLNILKTGCCVSLSGLKRHKWMCFHGGGACQENWCLISNPIHNPARWLLQDIFTLVARHSTYHGECLGIRHQCECASDYFTSLDGTKNHALSPCSTQLALTNSKALRQYVLIVYLYTIYFTSSFTN